MFCWQQQGNCYSFYYLNYSVTTLWNQPLKITKGALLLSIHCTIFFLSKMWELRLWLKRHQDECPHKHIVIKYKFFKGAVWNKILWIKREEATEQLLAYIFTRKSVPLTTTFGMAFYDQLGFIFGEKNCTTLFAW